MPQPEDEKTAHARAFELTNQLLASGDAIEINVVASRLALASPRLTPAMYALRRTGAAADLSRHDAAAQLLSAYLSAAVFAPIRKLPLLFQLLLSRAELDSSVAELIDSGQVDRARIGKADILVSL